VRLPLTEAEPVLEAEAPEVSEAVGVTLRDELMLIAE